MQQTVKTLTEQNAWNVYRECIEQESPFIYQWMKDSIENKMVFQLCWQNLCPTPLSFEIKLQGEPLDFSYILRVFGSQTCLIKTSDVTLYIESQEQLISESARLKENGLVQEMVGDVDGRMVYTINKLGIGFLGCLLKDSQGEWDFLRDNLLINKFCRNTDDLAKQLQILGHRGFLVCKTRINLSGRADSWVVGANLQLPESIKNCLQAYISEPERKSLTS